jgi:hypothetical protein
VYSCPIWRSNQSKIYTFWNKEDGIKILGNICDIVAYPLTLILEIVKRNYRAIHFCGFIYHPDWD